MPFNNDGIQFAWFSNNSLKEEKKTWKNVEGKRNSPVRLINYCIQWSYKDHNHKISTTKIKMFYLSCSLHKKRYCYIHETLKNKSSERYERSVYYTQNKNKNTKKIIVVFWVDFVGMSPNRFGNSKSIHSLTTSPSLIPHNTENIWEVDIKLVLPMLENNYIIATQSFVRWPRILAALSSKQLIQNWKLHASWLKKEYHMKM